MLPDFSDKILDARTCQTSPPLPLNKDGTFKNLLLGQTITLSLNLRLVTDFDLGSLKLSPTLCTQRVLSGPDGLVGTSDDEFDPSSALMQFTIPSSVLSALGPGATVNDLLALANEALAGLPAGDARLSEVTAALDAINRGFDNHRLLVNCPTLGLPRTDGDGQMGPKRTYRSRSLYQPAP
jgi:hypothetical protein